MNPFPLLLPPVPYRRLSWLAFLPGEREGIKKRTSMTRKQIKQRLEQIRTELRAERISYGELYELEALSKHIAPGDVELAEAAGIPEAEFRKRSKGHP